MSPRSYDSPLRQQQAQQTRDRILEAMVELLAEGRDDVPMSRVAEVAGVSLRTVHHHFPDRDSRVEALADFIEQRAVGQTPKLESVDDLTSYASGMTHRFFAHEEMLRAQMAPGLGKEVRELRKGARKRKTLAAFRKAMRSTKSAKEIAALFDTVVRGDTMVTLHDVHDMPVERIEACVTWVARLMGEAVERGDVP